MVAGPHDSGSEVVWRICFIFSVYLIPCINIHSVNTHNHFVRIGAGQGKGGEGQGRGKGRAGQGRAGGLMEGCGFSSGFDFFVRTVAVD